MKPSQNTRRIPILQIQTFCGSGVPEDWEKWKISNFREIRDVKGVAWNERCVGIPITGDSLKHLGVCHGDILITKLTHIYDQKKIGIWQTPHGRTAKFAKGNKDGTVTLHNKNGWTQVWQNDEIQLVGVVVRIERDNCDF